ncbi:hypothetical protein M378DRAFT_170627 [Amanita muscaria Koide BX008]|uniref:Uncharacterized protein n=1 Tax=Amanita muscaria (strain Koide BX008) TaxID=946122 RepID=A0A0C2WQ47_AMAMK|nr:hypothetical protein M378DRAFT_170627 [Amanita muscaria Koide BX008]
MTTGTLRPTLTRTTPNNNCHLRQMEMGVEMEQANHDTTKVAQGVLEWKRLMCAQNIGTDVYHHLNKLSSRREPLP